MITSRALVVAVAAVLTAVLVPVLGSPAGAATTVVFPPGPWAGDLSVQVTSDQPYVGYSMLTSSQRSLDRVVAKPSPGSPFTVTVPTWGMGEAAR